MREYTITFTVHVDGPEAWPAGAREVTVNVRARSRDDALARFQKALEEKCDEDFNG